MGTLAQLQQIFNEIQTCTPQAYAARAQDAVEMAANDASFLTVLHTVLASKKASLPDRVLGFLRRIFEGLGKAHQGVLERIFYYLLDFVDSKSCRCRKHALHLLSMILGVAKYPLARDTLQRISERLFDRDAGVRREALRICLEYQEHELGEGLRLVGVLKDVVRFDQSHEVRRAGLAGIVVAPETLNCIVERCTDVNVGVRRAFWAGCFERLQLREIPAPQRVYLMKSALSEREFDARSIFLQAVERLGLEEFVDCFYCEEKAFGDVVEHYLRQGREELALTRLTPGYVCMMGIYYRLKEDDVGRDGLDLMDLDEFLDLISERCRALEARMQGPDGVLPGAPPDEDIKTLVGLFRLLAFYDLFGDRSRRRVLKIINSLLARCSARDVVEEAVLLCKRICSSDLVSFLGSVIKKLRGSPLCYTVSECVMKCLPHGELHEAIFQEIAIPNLNESLEIVFWYFLLRPSKNLEELLLSFLPNAKAVRCVADLVLAGHVDPGAVSAAIESQLFRFDENVAIPTAKLLLARRLAGSEYFKYLLLIFYSTEDGSIQQYLSLFFYEYFAHDPQPVIDVFCDVMQLITDNYRVFADQALFWISNSQAPHGTQHLFFSICCHMLRGYDGMKNRRLLFFTLDRISIQPCWEPVLTKKIIYVLGQIIKKRPKEQTQHLLAKLMEIDDGSPLDAGEFTLLRDALGTAP